MLDRDMENLRLFSQEVFELAKKRQIAIFLATCAATDSEEELTLSCTATVGAAHQAEVDALFAASAQVLMNSRPWWRRIGLGIGMILGYGMLVAPPKSMQSGIQFGWIAGLGLIGALLILVWGLVDWVNTGALPLLQVMIAVPVLAWVLTHRGATTSETLKDEE